MTQRTADRLRRTPPAPVALARLDIPQIAQAELTQAVLGLAVQLNGLMHPSDLAQMQARGAHLHVHVEDQAVVVLPGFAMPASGHHLPREWARFEAAEVVMQHGGCPVVFLVEVGVVVLHRTGGALVRVHVAGALVVPGVERVLAHPLLSHQRMRVGLAVIHAAFHDQRGVAAVDGRLLVLVLVRQIAPGDVFADATAVLSRPTSSPMRQ